MNITKDDIQADVKKALSEDIGSGDITAAMIDADTSATAELIAREDAVLAGQAWFDEVFRQLEPAINIQWHVKDGDTISTDQLLCQITGPARSILTGERSAINFLQTLSGTATTVASHVEILKNTDTKVLDTRKTIPGLRRAQKYAVECGGGKNHRIGLYDAFLIKENHILAKGGILPAVETARQQNLPVEIEVETLDELEQALSAKADIILLDNFNPEQLTQAVEMNQGQAKLEASGNITKENLLEIAQTGVDYISIGALTKHLRAIDFSLRVSTPGLGIRD